MPTIRIDNPDLLASLLEDLKTRTDVVAEAVSEDTIRINILGSYNTDHMRIATYLRVRAWEAAQPALFVDMEVAPVTHSLWESLTEEEKFLRIGRCIMDART